MPLVNEVSTGVLTSFSRGIIEYLLSGIFTPVAQCNLENVRRGILTTNEQH